MTLTGNNIRMILTFRENLDLVAVQVWTADENHPLQHLGVLRGRNQLLHLMEAVDVGHYLSYSTEMELPIPVPDVTAIACDPERLVELLERRFRWASELDLRLMDEESTEGKESLRPPGTLTICSSSLTGAAGLGRIKGWFAALKASEQTPDLDTPIDKKQASHAANTRSATDSHRPDYA